MVILIPSLPLIIFDYLMAQDEPGIVYLSLVRAVLATLPVILLLPLKRIASYRKLDWLMFGYSIYICFESVFLIKLFHAEPGIMAARVPLYIVSANVMFSIAAWQRISTNLIAMPLFIGAFWLFSDASVQVLVAITSMIVIAHAFGFAAGSWLSCLRRAEFTRSTELEESNLALIRSSHQLEEANAAKSIFLSNVSHELRTPLNAIIGFSEMLQHRIFAPLGDRRYDGYAEDIAQSGRTLLNLIDDLLDLNKVEAGKLDMQATMSESY